MFIKRIKIKNWKNFREADVMLRDRMFIIGPNASGKSNFLDIFRFLRDISKREGGGLQKAVKDRGGIKKLRCLHARSDPEVLIEIYLSETIDISEDSEDFDWKYQLSFKSEGKIPHRLLVSSEQVWKRGKSDPLLSRPDKHDNYDKDRLTQTYLEQISANSEFREIADYFGDAVYLHIVPQLLKYGEKIGGNRLEDDPFGQGFLERIAKCSSKIRDSRLKKISEALRVAVPKFEELRFIKDEITGYPHLEARYEHHRPNAGWQREDQFSDGTLRLLGLLWSVFEGGDTLLLLEEPELSLNNAIVEQIPRLLFKIQKGTRHNRQIIISTHSEALLSNKGIDSCNVLILEPKKEGTSIRSPNSDELGLVSSGLSVADVLLPKVTPRNLEQLGLFK